jgi:anti-sigma B factor antagonist
MVINGLPVIVTPAEIDLTTAEQLRMVLFDSAGHGHATIVVDMTRTRFCNHVGLHVLVRAHRRALTEGGELRVIIPADSPIVQDFCLSGLHELIPWFTSLDQATAVLPTAPVSAIRRRHPRPQPGRAEEP